MRERVLAQAGWRLLLIAGLVGSGVGASASAADAAEDVQVTAYDLRFEPAIIDAPEATKLSVHLVNAGRQPHNIAFYDEEGGEPLDPGAVGPVILDGESATVTFMTPAAGEYFFVCSVHPLDMKGVLRVGGGSPGASQVEPSTGQVEPSPGQVEPSPRRDAASDPPGLVLAEHPRIDPTAFRVTTFAHGLPFTTAIQQLDDGSMLVALNESQNGGFLRSTGKLVRMADDDDDGVADRFEPVGIVGPIRGGHLRVYRDIPGAIVQMRRHGNLLFMTSRREVRSSISILRAPASADGPFELLDALELAFPEEHLHDTYSLALREEPDGLIALYFNVGSRLEGMSDPAQIEVTGLVSAQLQSESVYRLTLRDDGPSARALDR